MQAKILHRRWYLSVSVGSSDCQICPMISREPLVGIIHFKNRYHDDVLIASKGKFSEHKKFVNINLLTLDTQKFAVKWPKCEFLAIALNDRL